MAQIILGGCVLKIRVGFLQNQIEMSHCDEFMISYSFNAWCHYCLCLTPQPHQKTQCAQAFMCSLETESETTLLERISEFDQLHKCGTVSCVEVAAAPQPGTICGTQYCSISTAQTITDYVLCPVQSKINRCDVCTLLKKQQLGFLLIKMTGSNSGIGSASGQMRRKLESAFGSVPKLLRKNH